MAYSYKPTDHSAKNKEAAELNKKYGMPELKGSEKQIAWAESIRAGVIADLNDACDTYFKKYFGKKLSAKNPERTRALQQTLMQAINAVKSKGIADIKQEKSAAYWIDNRDTPWKARYSNAIDDKWNDIILNTKSLTHHFVVGKSYTSAENPNFSIKIVKGPTINNGKKYITIDVGEYGLQLGVSARSRETQERVKSYLGIDYMVIPSQISNNDYTFTALEDDKTNGKSNSVKDTIKPSKPTFVVDREYKAIENPKVVVRIIESTIPKNFPNGVLRVVFTKTDSSIKYPHFHVGDKVLTDIDKNGKTGEQSFVIFGGMGFPEVYTFTPDNKPLSEDKKTSKTKKTASKSKSSSTTKTRTPKHGMTAKQIMEAIKGMSKSDKEAFLDKLNRSLPENKQEHTYKAGIRRGAYIADAKRVSKSFGWRLTKDGKNVYYEGRSSRADSDPERTWHGTAAAKTHLKKIVGETATKTKTKKKTTAKKTTAKKTTKKTTSKRK